MRARIRLLLLAAVLTFAGCGNPVPRFVAREAKEPAVAEASTDQLHGIASYYGDDFHGRRTANGEVYDMYNMTAAHRTLPFNTRVRVRNLDTGRSVVVRINDRGPFKDDRVIDLSMKAATELGMIAPGTARVALEILELGDSTPSKVQ
jgi:rare lipoprotein A